MSHQVSCIDGVFTVRLEGRVNAQAVYQDIRANLDKQPSAVSVILDLTTATNFDQNLKALCYRVFQHGYVGRVGICGVNPTNSNEVKDLVTALQRVRRVAVGRTEVDVLTEMGLAAPIPEQRKLSGMLTHLKSAQTTSN